MIRTLKQARAVHARRAQSGKAGVGVAVRRFIKRGGWTLDDVAQR